MSATNEMPADTADPPATTSSGTTPLQLAALASAAAGLVHAAAAGTHTGDTTLARLFAVTAAVQLGWAALAAVRPSRAVAWTGVGLGALALGAWVLSRTTGLPVIASLEEVEPVGVQDGLAALLAGLSMLSAAASAFGVRLPRTVLRMPVGAVGAVALLALAVPAVAAQHAHGPSHEHDGGAGGHHDEAAGAIDHSTMDHSTMDHSTMDHGAAGHDAAAPDGDHAHGGATPDDAGAPSHGDHGSEPIISLTDARITDAQRTAAQDLIDTTTAGMARFTDVASVQAAGYVSIGDGLTGWEHFVHIGHMADGVDLDPDKIESVVFKVYPDGTRQLASAMYILGFGATMDTVPDIAGELTSWHDHQDLCWEGVRVVGTTRATGKCERGTFRGTAPMLHVWMINNRCGPFAGIEGSHGSGCSHGHDDTAAEGTAGPDEETAAGP